MFYSTKDELKAKLADLKAQAEASPKHAAMFERIAAQYLRNNRTIR